MSIYEFHNSNLQFFFLTLNQKYVFVMYMVMDVQFQNCLSVQCFPDGPNELAIAVPPVPPLARECRCLPASWMSHRSRMFGGSCRLATVRTGAGSRMRGAGETAVSRKTD